MTEDLNERTNNQIKIVNNKFTYNFKEKNIYMKKILKNKRKNLTVLGVLIFSVGIGAYFVTERLKFDLKPIQKQPMPVTTVPRQPSQSAPRVPSVSQQPATLNKSLIPPTTLLMSDYTNEVVKLCNAERQKAGISLLTSNNSSLQQAANLRASEIKKSFSHIRPNDQNFFSVLKEFGVSYTHCGENIAYGQTTPQQVVTGWMNSPGHRANILNKNFNQIAVGLNGTHWVQLFVKE